MNRLTLGRLFSMLLFDAMTPGNEMTRRVRGFEAGNFRCNCLEVNGEGMESWTRLELFTEMM